MISFWGVVLLSFDGKKYILGGESVESFDF